MQRPIYLAQPHWSVMDQKVCWLVYRLSRVSGSTLEMRGKDGISRRYRFNRADYIAHALSTRTIDTSSSPIHRHLIEGVSELDNNVIHARVRLGSADRPNGEGLRHGAFRRTRPEIMCIGALRSTAR